MVVVPTATPITAPVAALIVAIVVSLLDQVCDGVIDDNVVLPVGHITIEPVITAGVAPTVTVVLLTQPVGKV